MTTPKPSIKTLTDVCGNEPHLAIELRAILKAPIADVMARIESLLHHGYCESKAYARMLALNEAGHFYGVESIGNTSGEYADYLNSGDSYTSTIIYWRGRYRVQSVGDFIETMERRGMRFN